MPYKDPEKRKEVARKWRLKNPEYHRGYYQENKTYFLDKAKEYRKNPIIRRNISARSALNYALAKGRVAKLPCQECGDEKSEAHHPDHRKPLEVIWLCKKHHIHLHSKEE